MHRDESMGVPAAPEVERRGGGPGPGGDPGRHRLLAAGGGRTGHLAGAGPGAGHSAAATGPPQGRGTGSPGARRLV